LERGSLVLGTPARDRVARAAFMMYPRTVSVAAAQMNPWTRVLEWIVEHMELAREASAHARMVTLGRAVGLSQPLRIRAMKWIVEHTELARKAFAHARMVTLGRAVGLSQPLWTRVLEWIVELTELARKAFAHARMVTLGQAVGLSQPLLSCATFRV